jgi:hypothetical protein
MWHMGFICPRNWGEKRLMQKGYEPRGRAGYLISNPESLMLD